MINEAIILAGGLGTRLRSAVADLPKCMAPVDGIPFIHFIVAFLEKEGIQNFIFSLGYKNEVIITYLDTAFPQTNKKYIIETEQLGTGGAIKKAVSAVAGENVIVVNGDTLFNIDISRLTDFHERKQADCSLALKQMTNFSRYGSVELSSGDVIKAFREKEFCEKGNINGGIYALNIASFLSNDLREVFSFEKWLEENTAFKKLYGDVYENYFIDIGIPDDYNRFREDYNLILAKHNKNSGAPGQQFPKDFFDLLD